MLKVDNNYNAKGWRCNVRIAKVQNKYEHPQGKRIWNELVFKIGIWLQRRHDGSYKVQSWNPKEENSSVAKVAKIKS